MEPIKKLDSLLTLETPEGVCLSLHLAGPMPRVLAFLIDLLIRAAVLLALALTVGKFGLTGQGLLMIAAFLLEWLYPVLFEVYARGATPGKRAMGIAVVETSGLPVGWQASLVRNILRFADFLPFLYACGFLSMLGTRHFQRLGDLAAGTVVVWRQPERQYLALPAQAPIEPGMRLQLEEQQNLINFAERLDTLSHERQIELADIAAPLSGQSGQTGLERLLGMANYLAGKR